MSPGTMCLLKFALVGMLLLQTETVSAGTKTGDVANDSLGSDWATANVIGDKRVHKLISALQNTCPEDVYPNAQSKGWLEKITPLTRKLLSGANFAADDLSPEPSAAIKAYVAEHFGEFKYPKNHWVGDGKYTANLPQVGMEAETSVMAMPLNADAFTAAKKFFTVYESPNKNNIEFDSQDYIGMFDLEFVQRSPAQISGAGAKGTEINTELSTPGNPMVCLMEESQRIMMNILDAFLHQEESSVLNQHLADHIPQDLYRNLIKPMPKNRDFTQGLRVLATWWDPKGAKQQNKGLALATHGQHMIDVGPDWFKSTSTGEKQLPPQEVLDKLSVKSEKCSMKPGYILFPSPHPGLKALQDAVNTGTKKPAVDLNLGIRADGGVQMTGEIPLDYIYDIFADETNKNSLDILNNVNSAVRFQWTPAGFDEWSRGDKSLATIMAFYVERWIQFGDNDYTKYEGGKFNGLGDPKNGVLPVNFRSSLAHVIEAVKAYRKAEPGKENLGLPLEWSEEDGSKRLARTIIKMIYGANHKEEHIESNLRVRIGVEQREFNPRGVSIGEWFDGLLRDQFDLVSLYEKSIGHLGVFQKTDGIYLAAEFRNPNLPGARVEKACNWGNMIKFYGQMLGKLYRVPTDLDGNDNSL